jgi:hypothetical protein
MDRDPSASRRRLTRPEAPAPATPGIIPFGAIMPLFGALLLFDIFSWAPRWRSQAADLLANLTGGNRAAGLVLGLLLGLSGLPVIGGTLTGIRRAAEGRDVGRVVGLAAAIVVTLTLAPFHSVLVGARNGADFDSYFNRRVPNAQTGYLIGLFASLGLLLLGLWIYQGRMDRRSSRGDHGRS